jgi:hypothetical protein
MVPAVWNARLKGVQSSALAKGAPAEAVEIPPETRTPPLSKRVASKYIRSVAISPVAVVVPAVVSMTSPLAR